MIDRAAIAHQERGWVEEFAKEFGIDVIVVPGFEARHEAMLAVQARQRR